MDLVKLLVGVAAAWIWGAPDLRDLRPQALEQPLRGFHGSVNESIREARILIDCTGYYVLHGSIAARVRGMRLIPKTLDSRPTERNMAAAPLS